MAEVRARSGYRRVYALFLREGWQINHKRGYRLYREEGHNLRRKARERRKSICKIHSTGRPGTFNECRAMDFVGDQLNNGKSITGESMANVLDQAKNTRRLPRRIKVDHGSALFSKALDAGAYFNHMRLDYSRPGTPAGNAMIESFNGRFRDERLNTGRFLSPADAGDKRGVIFDIKEFAINDGPGIRQTIFLKGCPMRCNWCHNPEGFRMEPELMVSAGCTNCGHCEEVCKHTECVACGDCIKACPGRLRTISGEIMTSKELITLILERNSYYARYGGGVTFSGGEPLFQPDFLIEVLDGLTNVHRALETSGYASQIVFKDVCDRIDFIMMDIKIIDDKLHQTMTGVSNRPILKNLEQLCTGGKPFIIRIPLIPGVNDNEHNYKETAKLLRHAPTLQKVELLPYHKTAGAKYKMLGRNYEPKFDINRATMISQEAFDEYGIRSSVL
jgi:pyruvate formate lyase activating enzyme